MRKIRDPGIAKLAAAAHRAERAKRTKLGGSSAHHSSPRGFRKRRRLGPKGRAKASVVMSEFFHGSLTSHGRRVPRSRPDIGKAIAMSEGRAADKPKRRRRRRKASGTAQPKRTPKRRVVRAAAPKARRPSHRRKSPRRAVKATRRPVKRAKPKHAKGRKEPSPKQLAARRKFVEMVRARAKKARAARR